MNVLRNKTTAVEDAEDAGKEEVAAEAKEEAEARRHAKTVARLAA